LLYWAHPTIPTLESLALSDFEFDEEIRSLIQEGLGDGDIGYREWWSIAHNLKMAKMELVFCKEAIKQIKANPNSVRNIADVLEVWKTCPNGKDRAERWMSILENGDWDTVLAMDSEGLRLREMSPMRFALSEGARFEITRKYCR
jgi:hypothetical protein